MNLKNTSVHIAVPNQGWINKQVTTSLLQMLMGSMARQDLLDIHFNFISDISIDNSRNTLCRDTLRIGADWLLMIDSDNAPVKNPLHLLPDNKDVIIFPTPVWASKLDPEIAIGRVPIYWNCMDWKGDKDGWVEHQPRTGWQEIDAGGTGCILIARRVLEAVPPPWFTRRLDEHGVVTHGSDYLFCQRAKEAGFKIWANYDYCCSHIKEIDLTSVYMLLKARDVSHINAPNINTPEYWDDQWSMRDERILPVYGKILELLRPGESVLDFGCGRGDLLAMIAAQGRVDTQMGMDFSPEAIAILSRRGLLGEVGDNPADCGREFDTIVSTQVLEHLDDDRSMLMRMFGAARRVIYSVPCNCLPPGVEPEHRRVYTEQHIHRITPFLKNITEVENYYLVEAEKEVTPATT